MHFHHNIKISKAYLKWKMSTYYRNINYTIVQFNYKKKCNYHSNSFTIFFKMNLQKLQNSFLLNYKITNWWIVFKNPMWCLKSHVGAPTSFMKKKDGSLHVCGLWSRLQQNHHKDLLSHYWFKNFQTRWSSKTFIKINIVYMKQRSEWKTTFCIRYVHFVAFGLTNALIIFWHVMKSKFISF